jgi:hypothetical protein
VRDRADLRRRMLAHTEEAIAEAERTAALAGMVLRAGPGSGRGAAGLAAFVARTAGRLARLRERRERLLGGWPPRPRAEPAREGYDL